MLTEEQMNIAEEYRDAFYDSISEDHYLQEALKLGYSDMEVFFMAHPEIREEYEYLCKGITEIKSNASYNEEELGDVPF